MNNSKIFNFFIGLFIEISISLLLNIGTFWTVVFALLYIMSYIPGIYKACKNNKNM